VRVQGGGVGGRERERIRECEFVMCVCMCMCVCVCVCVLVCVNACVRVCLRIFTVYSFTHTCVQICYPTLTESLVFFRDGMGVRAVFVCVCAGESARQSGREERERDRERLCLYVCAMWVCVLFWCMCVHVLVNCFFVFS